jgi:tripartite-type tricarboxylate transporter receptor subunit TctC
LGSEARVPEEYPLFQLTRWAVAAFVATFLAPALCIAQDGDWPNRTIQIVVPYTPGTGGDILARVFGPRLAERWKVAVVVDNRPGASGNIGTDFVAKAAPDGYTLLCTATSFGTSPAVNRNLPFDPIKSFAPVIQLASSSVSVIVTPSLPAQSMREFIELARREPGRLYYASPGNGGPQHLAMELLKQEAHINLVHVPYKGSGSALTDLVGGHVQAMIVSLQTAAPYVQSGKLRMLAVMSGARPEAFPDVPTLKELGLGDLEVDTWYGVFAPAGTSAAVVAKVNAELNALLKQPELRSFLAKQGMNPVGGSPERFAELVRKELARWSRVVANAGIKAD